MQQFIRNRQTRSYYLEFQYNIWLFKCSAKYQIQQLHPSIQKTYNPIIHFLYQSFRTFQFSETHFIIIQAITTYYSNPQKDHLINHLIFNNIYYNIMYPYFRKKVNNLRSGQPNPGITNAHSPYHQFINDIENKRSRLFPDRRKVPGRKFKFAFVTAILLHYYCESLLSQVKKQWSIKEQVMRKLQRKVSPYFSSIEDIEFTTVKHRNDLILAQIFKEKGGMNYVKNWKRFNNQIIWASSTTENKFVLAGTGRSQNTVRQNLFGRVVAGVVDQNA